MYPLSPVQKRVRSSRLRDCRAGCASDGGVHLARYNRPHPGLPCCQSPLTSPRFPVTAFFALAVLMLCIALAFVLLPLLHTRPDTTAEISDELSNVAIFRAWKHELDDDLARGAITSAERDTAVADLGTRLIAEVPASAPVVEAPRGKRPWLLAWIFAVLMTVGAFALYRSIGTPAALQMDSVMASAPKAGGADAPISDKQILAMVDSLAKKMEANPDDPRGWVLLARSQAALGRMTEAVQAYERAIKLVPGDAQLLADYADVSVMQQEGRFEGKPMALIARALKADPNNIKALALAGTAEIKAGKRDAALRYWEKLRTLVPKDSDDFREIENIIADVKSGKAMLAAAANNTPAPASGPVPLPNPPPNSLPAKAAATGSASISGRVTIDPGLAAKIAPGDTLFVFARALNGPKMPLAVLRIPVPKQWPFDFELNDAMAMAPGMNLSSFPQVTIDARISKAGNAMPQPGDLSGQSAAVAPGARAVVVNISRVLP